MFSYSGSEERQPHRRASKRLQTSCAMESTWAKSPKLWSTLVSKT